MKRVGVLRGGEENMQEDYESSLKEGGEVIAFLYENMPEKYKPVDILIDREGVWHVNGLPIRRADLIHKVDVVWNTAHSSEASVLSNFSIPSVGRSAFSYAIENSPEMLREHMKKIGVQVPRQIAAPQSAREVFEKFSSPWIVESGRDIFLAHTFPELSEALAENSVISVTEFIPGKPGVVHAIPDFRGEDLYIMPPTVVPGHPGGFSPEEKEEVISFARDLHSHLGALHYLKTNFILHPRRGFFVTNISFSPDLRENSHLAQSLHSVGSKLHHLVEHILERASN